MGRHRNVAQTIWATLQSHTSENSQTVQYKNKSVPFVFDKSTDSVWSLVDDWQEECVEQVNLANSLKKGPQEKSAHLRYEFVTFHQAYSYEDFVEGIRPVLDDETGDLTYMVVPGVFQRIAQKAKADPDQRYAIFIDEINRGNIAKIFGELITLPVTLAAPSNGRRRNRGRARDGPARPVDRGALDRRIAGARATGEPGTIVWGHIPPTGTLFLML